LLLFLTHLIKISQFDVFHGCPTSPPHTLNEVPVAVKDPKALP